MVWASRARIVATADATRRQIERDLHDGAQQQLVWLALALRAAQATVPEELEQHRSELDRVVDGLTARARRPPRDRARHSSGRTLRGRPDAGAQATPRPFPAPRQPRSPSRWSISGAGGGDGLLRRLGVVDERSEVRGYPGCGRRSGRRRRRPSRGGSRRRTWWRGPGRGLGTARPERPRRRDRRHDATYEPTGCGDVVARGV